MDAAMRRLTQQAEARGVIVEARQRDQQPLDDRRRRRHHRTETHLGVELLLELLDLFVVELGRAHDGAPYLVIPASL